MAITYHAGRRIQGTSTDATAVSGGWKEIGRTTLGSSGDNISVASLSDKRYLMFLTYNTATGGDAIQRVRLNSDTGSNYARRNSWDGGSDSTATSQPFMTQNNGSLTLPTFSVGYLSNLASAEKLMLSESVGQDTAGAGTSPTRSESVGKWANTSDAISEVTMYNSEAGSYASGSECVVLGWDESDTHTDNFWEELASVDLSGGSADTLSTGTFTAKKYLWIQYFAKSVTDIAGARITFNSDTGSNYSRRQEVNDSAGSSQNLSNIDVWNDDMTTGTTGSLNLFMINNSATEKLGIGRTNQQLGSGAGTAPQRREASIKWANTNSQITNITLTNHRAGSLDTPTTLKVWGSN